MAERREHWLNADGEAHRSHSCGRVIGSALLRDARFSLRALRRSPGLDGGGGIDLGARHRRDGETQ